MRVLVALAAAAAAVLVLAGCDSGSASSSDHAALTSVEATVGAVESEVAGDAGR